MGHDLMEKHYGLSVDYDGAAFVVDLRGINVTSNVAQSNTYR